MGSRDERGADDQAALGVLEPGQALAEMARPVAGDPCLWTPGVKYGVRRGRCTHMTEFVGPVLR